MTLDNKETTTFCPFAADICSTVCPIILPMKGVDNSSFRCEHREMAMGEYNYKTVRDSLYEP